LRLEVGEYKLQKGQTESTSSGGECITGGVSPPMKNTSFIWPRMAEVGAGEHELQGGRAKAQLAGRRTGAATAARRHITTEQSTIVTRRAEQYVTFAKLNPEQGLCRA
jgi:hypothetical protein